MTHFARVRFVLMAVVLLLPVLSALAEGDAEAVDARELLRLAGEAAEAARTITYEYTYEGHGSLAGSFVGSVKLLKGERPGAFSSRTEIRSKPGTEPALPIDRIIATSGPQVRSLDRSRHLFAHGTQRGGSAHLLSYAYYAILFQYLMPDPFAPELGGETVEPEGTETVAGVECDVVRATNNSYGGADVWWSLGREDRLPRAQTWKVTTPGVDGGFRFEIQDLTVGVELAESDFELEAPEGYEVVSEDERAVGVGDPAPGWRLPTPSGEHVELAGLRGQAVVLDFWASWCPPCWRLMPEVEKLAQEFGDRGVRFFGVNSWESPKVDPAAYAAEKDLHYPMLLGGETVASNYKIGTLPALFVVGPDGRIAYAANPVAGDPETVGSELREILSKLSARPSE